MDQPQSQQSRDQKREESLRAIRESGEAAGVHPVLIADAEASLRSAFYVADMMGDLFPGLRP